MARLPTQNVPISILLLVHRASSPRPLVPDHWWPAMGPRTRNGRTITSRIGDRQGVLHKISQLANVPMSRGRLPELVRRLPHVLGLGGESACTPTGSPPVIHGWRRHCATMPHVT